MERITSERPTFYHYHGANERAACPDITAGETYTELGGFTMFKAFGLTRIMNFKPSPHHIFFFVFAEGIFFFFFENLVTHTGALFCLRLNEKGLHVLPA